MSEIGVEYECALKRVEDNILNAVDYNLINTIRCSDIGELKGRQLMPDLIDAVYYALRYCNTEDS